MKQRPYTETDNLAHMVNKFNSIYETWSPITVYTRARY